MTLKKALYIFFTLLGFTLKAQQETVISGRVTEAGTNGGIPFVNVYFKGTVIGATTDFDGNYLIKTTTPKDSVFVSLIGYKSKAKAIKKGKMQVVDFQLNPEALNLSTVEVRPGVNPAIRIIKNCQNNRDKYNREALGSVQYISYTKQETDVDNVTPKMRKWRLFRDFTNMWDTLDKLAGEESKANLPVAMSEVTSEIYSYKEAGKKRENVNAVKLKFVGMKDGSALSQLSGTDFQNFNFYNNNVSIQGNNTMETKDFLSPLADNAMLFYDYYLVDSSFIDSTKCYRIDCIPKNKKDLAYTGAIWITDTTFALKQLDLEIVPGVNVNFLDRARIQQTLIPTDAGPWVPSQTRTMIDYSTLTDKFVSLITHTYNCNKFFVVNKPREKEFYDTRITYAEDAITKDTAWWRQNRPEPLNRLEAKSYDMIDTVRQIPFIKNGVNVLYFLFSGYKDIGPVDIGHYMESYSRNRYEGDKVKLGFRTNVKFSKSWIISGYGAYGFKDKGFKYKLQVERILSRYPWSTVKAMYRNDVDYIGSDRTGSGYLNLGQSPNTLFNTFSQIGNVAKLVKKQEARLSYEREFNIGLSSVLTFQNKRTNPLFPVAFGDQFTIFQQRKYSITEILLDLKYSADERFVQNGTERISFGNKKSPVFRLNFTQGLKNVFGSDFTYSKVSLSYENRFRMATMGYSKVFVKIGKVFSQVPYLLLEIPQGNETYIYANNTFNQMSNFEFVSDQYIEAFWQHHFNGLFFNRVPLLKRFDLREVVGLNMAYGTLSAKNKSFNANNSFTVMDDVPYFEADLGVENILDVIRVDFLYRLTYNDDFYHEDYSRTNQGNNISNWGIKVGLQFSF